VEGEVITNTARVEKLMRCGCYCKPGCSLSRSRSLWASLASPMELLPRYWQACILNRSNPWLDRCDIVSDMVHTIRSVGTESIHDRTTLDEHCWRSNHFLFCVLLLRRVRRGCPTTCSIRGRIVLPIYPSCASGLVRLAGTHITRKKQR
jgi:hypothetical protein